MASRFVGLRRSSALGNNQKTSVRRLNQLETLGSDSTHSTSNPSISCAVKCQADRTIGPTFVQPCLRGKNKESGDAQDSL